MKIALYVPAWPPGFSPNGIVTYASHVVPALRQLGHEVFVVTYRSDETVDPYTIELRRFMPKPNFLDRAIYRVAPHAAQFNRMSSAIARALSALHSQHKIDVFETEESFGWSATISHLNLVPVVVRLHGPHFLMGQFDNQHTSRKAIRYRQQCEGRGIRRAHYVTANCFDTLKAVKHYYGLRLTRSRVIPNPIDAACDSKTWRLDTCDQDNLLFVGRFDKVKGGDLVLRAFGRLAASLPKLKLTFVGPDRGVETHDGKKYSFHQFIDEALPESVRSRVTFCGQISHAEVMSLRTRHFLTIVAAQYDTMGYMMTEAMSLGCPIVSTAVGGIPEYIQNQKNGLLIPPQDADAMAAACKSMLENKNQAARMGRQAWLDCRDLYSPKNIAMQMIATYRDVVDRATLSTLATIR